MQIKKAERKSVKIKLAITGPSGSGKTMGALMLAKGIAPNGKILVIDTEDGSSNLYADHALTQGIEYDVLELDAPYLTKKYIQALELGQENGYDVIVVDSISHAWAGEGGILDRKTAMDQRGGNSFTNWGKLTPEQERFKSALVHAKAHVIATMRSKQDYVMEANERGKQAPKKVGLAPVQREGMEYEFTTVFDIGMSHDYVVSKDRTGLFDGRVERLTVKIGEEIRNWLESGKAETNSSEVRETKKRAGSQSRGKPNVSTTDEQKPDVNPASYGESPQVLEVKGDPLDTVEFAEADGHVQMITQMAMRGQSKDEIRAVFAKWDKATRNDVLSKMPKSTKEYLGVN